MNERDSEAVAAQLSARGYTLAAAADQADVVLLNTCSVRDLAEQKAIWKMQALTGEARARGEKRLFGYLGCMAQSRGDELLGAQDGVRLVVGTQKLHRTAEYVDDLLGGRVGQVADTEDEPGSQSLLGGHLSAPGAGQVSAFVSIMQGCNQHCTFCIVPSTRGQERSRPIGEIVDECRELVRGGVREITLLGQIVTSYGRREYAVRDGRSGFVQLLDAVHGIPGLERIRFTSPHPKGYGDDLVEAYGRLPKLVESAHLPLQSGSDRILKAMHRGYTRERFAGIVRKLRSVRAGMGLTTDIIVGFPGETEQDFLETLSLCEEVAFDNAFVFKYSPRRDTPAAVMPGQVEPAEIESRHRRLLDLINAMGRVRYESMVGTRVPILVEGLSRRNASRYEGRTRCNKIVVFPGSERHRGQEIEVRIERVGTFTLYGDPVVNGMEEGSEEAVVGAISGGAEGDGSVGEGER